jgi:WD40 repeat protein
VQKDNKSDLELKGHTDSVDQLCWDPLNENQLATASGDKTMRLWDTRSGKCLHTVATQGENINIAWSPDGQHIAVGSRDDIISFVDTRKYKVYKEQNFPFEVGSSLWVHDTPINPSGILRLPMLPEISQPGQTHRRQKPFRNLPLLPQLSEPSQLAPCVVIVIHFRYGEVNSNTSV